MFVPETSSWGAIRATSDIATGAESFSEAATEKAAATPEGAKPGTGATAGSGTTPEAASPETGTYNHTRNREPH